jgi:hypothetical protein
MTKSPGLPLTAVEIETAIKIAEHHFGVDNGADIAARNMLDDVRQMALSALSLAAELQEARREVTGLREEVLRLRGKVYKWIGDGPEPAKWTAPDGTIVYRSYEDYVDD